MAYFLLGRNKTTPDPGKISGPVKQKPQGEKMAQRENNRQSRHKAPKFKENQEEDLCWEDRRELQNHRKKSDKRPHQKDRTKTKW
jgi:hypothetical protein